MKALKNILDKHMGNSSFMKKVNLKLIVKFSNSFLENAFNSDVNKQIRAMQVKDNILTVACLDDSLLQELKLKELELLSAINGHFGLKTIEKIRYLA